MTKPKVLFVDDEPGIRTTLTAILDMHGFDVTTRGSVTEALTAIQKDTFDVLLTDLNIGQPADGFTLVSAMRRTQPKAVNVIITGYPAFETALHAIRAQVDDYFVKPADPVELVQRIQDRLALHDRRIPPPLKKLSYILQENAPQIIERFVNDMYAAKVFPVQSMDRTEVTNHFPGVLEELIEGLHSENQVFGGDMMAASRHGAIRCEQRFNIPMLVQEFSMFRRAVYETIQSNLLAVDVSSLIPDMIRIGQSLDARLKRAIEAFQSRCEDFSRSA
ncbi:MAG TPA: response regulator [Terriglobales bacterium]|nr:response regulator [Terriglobales bacterium]